MKVFSIAVWNWVLASHLAVRAASPEASTPIELKSPDGKLVVTFALREEGRLKGCPVYSVDYRGQRILAESRLGLSLKNGSALNARFTLTHLERSSRDETWKPVCGERNEIRDHYNELVADLVEEQDPSRRLRLRFRAYDEGVAFCYNVPAGSLGQFVISGEETQFRFAGNHTAYAVYSAQGDYTRARVRLDEVKANCERPLTIEIAGGPTVAIAEAGLVDYARMRLRPAKGQPYTLEAMLAGEVNASAPLQTPWRVLMVGDTPGQLLERNYLLLNLNSPCAIADTSWIKPGKVIREATLTTAGGKACVDFAVKMGLQYVEYDAGWYGPENDERSDATGVHLDPQRSKGPLDLQEVIRYASDRGIGIILYVNHRALEKQLDVLLPLYQQWGVKGIKFGFVNVGAQKWTAWLHEAVRKCAQHRLMVDVHDEYRMTGNSRTYPNLITVEGIGGDETMPTAQHNAILPFTRYLCGPGDHTICWYHNRIKNTLAHQLGSAIVFFSPWQFLYWYDKPSQYSGEAALELWKALPTIWDETRVLHGRIGEYVTIARRRGAEWYVGSLNAVERRTLEIPLAFLEAGRSYHARVYADGSPDGSDRRNVAVSELDVSHRTVLKAEMAANGGHAIRISPTR